MMINWAISKRCLYKQNVPFSEWTNLVAWGSFPLRGLGFDSPPHAPGSTGLKIPSGFLSE